MDVDPASLDPELRIARLSAIASAAFGLLSLCAAIIPVCGGTMSLFGIFLGYVSLRTEENRTALLGVILSGLGLLIAVVYFLFLTITKR